MPPGFRHVRLVVSTPSNFLIPRRPSCFPPPSAPCSLFARAMSSAPSMPPAPVLKRPVRLACVQFAAGSDKASNLTRAASLVASAAATGSRIVVLPECFNSPYGCSFFPKYAEPLAAPGAPDPPRDSSPSFHALRAMAVDNGIYLVGGSVPERDVSSGRLYNTCLVFAPDGALLASVRKLHLFDIDIPGAITFRESDVLSPGNRVALVSLPEYGHVAVSICYDMRFPEIAAIAARHGAFALIIPGAFNLTTGPLHWELLARARAVDNQFYVATCSPARDISAGYHAWGHSMIVDPLAKVVAEADEKEAIIHHELDGAKISGARQNIPIYTQRRFDVYPDVSQGKVQFNEPSS